MYLLSDVNGAQDALWEMMARRAVVLLPLDGADAPRMRELMRKYADRPMDFADAALVRVAERDGLRRIFTVDDSDFAFYRLHGRLPFQIV